MTVTAASAASQIKATGIIAILRGDFPVERVLAIGEALLAEGVRVLEVTLNSRGAIGAIAALRDRFDGRLLVGAGTVRTAHQFDEALSARAQFTVAPNLDAPTLERALAAGILHLPGCLTPTEAQVAFAAGCRMVKLFPADLGGPAYLQALRAPLDDIDFVATGGIAVANTADYARAGAAAVGVGSSLVSGAAQPVEEIAARARALQAAWEEGRGG